MSTMCVLQWWSLYCINLFDKIKYYTNNCNNKKCVPTHKKFLYNVNIFVLINLLFYLLLPTKIYNKLLCQYVFSLNRPQWANLVIELPCPCIGCVCVCKCAPSGPEITWSVPGLSLVLPRSPCPPTPPTPPKKTDPPPNCFFEMLYPLKKKLGPPKKYI